MELHAQIKKYRANMKLSQEELADRVFVTRQTISNWENGKSYPDINSLLLLSQVFDISLDQLIKGDIDAMREEIKEADIMEFNHYGRVYAILPGIGILSFVPLAKFFGVPGLIVSICIIVIACAYAVKLEKFYKKHNIRTYKEIVAFSEGKRLDELDKVREDAKLPYQKFLMGLLGAGVAILVFVLLELLI